MESTTVIDLHTTSVNCLIRSEDIGSVTIHNICNGAETVVYWGSADWFTAVF